jgi:predicted DNA binding CopG/RHH family protein
MAADALVQCRVPSATKLVLRQLAEREQISESALIRQLLATVVRTSSVGEAQLVVGREVENRDARLMIRLGADDRLLLSERAAARGMPAATYVAVLVRSHLRKLTPLPREETAALKRSIAELGAVGRNLNQIARAVSQGQRVEPPGRQDLLDMLKIATALRDHFKGLLKANEASWETGHASTKR